MWCIKSSDTSLIEYLTLAVVLEQGVGAAAKRPRLRAGAAHNVVRAPPRLPNVLQVVVVPRQIQLDSVLFQQRLHPACAKKSLRKNPNHLARVVRVGAPWAMIICLVGLSCAAKYSRSSSTGQVQPAGKDGELGLYQKLISFRSF